MALSFAAAYALVMTTANVSMTPQIDPQQHLCLAEAVYFEAGNQTYFGKIAVANVIMNRAKATGKTVCQVIRKPKQFSYRQMTAYKKQNIRIKQARVMIAMVNSITVARAALKEGLPDLTQGAKFYLNPVEATDFSWSSQFVKTVVIGDHHFYIDPKQRKTV